MRLSMYQSIDLQRETEEKARQPETKQLHKHATQQGYATQSEAEPETPNPHTGRETGLNNLSRGLGKTTHRSLAGGTRRDVRARPTQGRVAPAKGNAKLPKRPQDEGGPREARPASLHGLVGQVPEQRQGWGPKAPEGLDRHRHEGQGGGHRRTRRLEASRAAAANPGARAAPTAKEAAAGWMTETSPNTSRRGNTNMTSPRAPGPRGRGTPRGSRKREGADIYIYRGRVPVSVGRVRRDACRRPGSDARPRPALG
jgi:hypothetical protein